MSRLAKTGGGGCLRGLRSIWKMFTAAMDVDAHRAGHGDTIQAHIFFHESATGHVVDAVTFRQSPTPLKVMQWFTVQILIAAPENFGEHDSVLCRPPASLFRSVIAIRCQPCISV